MVSNPTKLMLFLCLLSSHLLFAGDAFLYYPFNDAEVKVQQGWIYTYSSSSHMGIDYVRGTIDQSSTWQSFDVLAAAGGDFTCAYSNTWGYYVLGRHEVHGSVYYTVYAHL